MRHVPQWINWRFEDHGLAKPAKVPCDVTTGERIDPLNHRKWLPYDFAAALSPGMTGFVLTPEAGYFCLDIDAAWDGIRWSDWALSAIQWFPGAYVEISISGTGLHIMGRGRVPAGFKTKNAARTYELYYHSRFIAITGINAGGDPELDFTSALSQFVPAHFERQDLLPASMGQLQWTDGPIEGAKPIEDDQELLRRMLSAKASAAVAFGGKASASDLWNNNVAALAEAWPSQTDEYDRSAADGALAAHLAFWTGKDCSRIERLMKMSKLARPKWERQDYMRATIAGAAARTSKVYTGPQGVPDIKARDAADGSMTIRTGWQYLTAEQQHEYFAGCCYIASQHRVFMPNGELRKPESFKTWFGGYEYQMSSDNAKPTKNAFEAFTESRVTHFPKADGLCFRPENQPLEIVRDGRVTLLNTYIPPLVTVTHGDPARWLDLMAKMFPNERDRAIIISYLAAMRQYIGRKFFWTPLIQGTPGNGKSAITNLVEYMVSPTYAHKPSAKELGDSGAKFNGWLERKLAIIIEEIYVSDRRDVLDAIKPLITDHRVEIQKKGSDQYVADNRANFILTSNHRDAIPKTDDDRRYAIFYTAQQSAEDKARDGMDGRYFKALYDWLKAEGYGHVTGWLERYSIPDEFNPAGLCLTAPITSSTAAAISESRGVVEQEIMQAVAESRPGFREGWVSSVALAHLLKEIGRNVPPSKRGAILRSLGYVTHPALYNGQLQQAIAQEDMKRPVLYVRKDSPFHNLQSGQEVHSAYVQAQAYGYVR